MVAAEAPGWLEDSIATTDELIAEGEYSAKTLDWGDVKPVFMEIQANKCIFCEQKMEDKRIHHDLEHFRPKSSIKKWPKRADSNLFDFKLGEKSDTGYFWLAYELFNYAASCKQCNTSQKSNNFPIAGARTLAAGTNVSDLNDAEKPFICYPIGSLDTDPEKIIEFNITVAKPVFNSGIKHRRARVMIELFKLNDRDDLHYQRAFAIRMLFLSLSMGDDEMVDLLLNGNAQHTSCLRSFHKLWLEDNARAIEAHDVCRQLLIDALENETPNLGV